MSLIVAATRVGARFVVTSRDYVYEAVRRDFKVGVFPLLDQNVVIEASY